MLPPSSVVWGESSRDSSRMSEALSICTLCDLLHNTCYCPGSSAAVKSRISLSSSTTPMFLFHSSRKDLTVTVTAQVNGKESLQKVLGLYKRLITILEPLNV